MLLMLLLDGGRLDFEARVGAGERVAACDDACRRCTAAAGCQPVPSHAVPLRTCLPNTPRGMCTLGTSNVAFHFQ